MREITYARHYDDTPKVRGILICTFFAFLIWMVEINAWTGILYGLYRLMAHFGNPANEISTLPAFWFTVGGTVAFVSAFAHFTPFVVYFGLRTRRAILPEIYFALFGTRCWGVSNTTILFVRSGS